MNTKIVTNTKIAANTNPNIDAKTKTNTKSKPNNKTRTTVPVHILNKLLRNQQYCCANKPGSNLNIIGDYKCPLWQIPKLNGKFDSAGHQVDHIVDFFKTQDNKIDNLQLLCPNCHAVKTLGTNTSDKEISKKLTDLILANFKISGNKKDYVTVGDMKRFISRHKKDFMTIPIKYFEQIIDLAFKTTRTKIKSKVSGWIGVCAFIDLTI